LPDGQEKLTEGCGLRPARRAIAGHFSWFETALTRLLIMKEMDVLILKWMSSSPRNGFAVTQG